MQHSRVGNGIPRLECYPDLNHAGIIVDVTGSFVLALLIGAGMAVFGALVYLLGGHQPD
jgi:hypothetical protein